MSLLPHVTASATQFTEAWLENRRLSDHTRDAYRRDVTSWLTWCAERGLDPQPHPRLGRGRFEELPDRPQLRGRVHRLRDQPGPRVLRPGQEQ